MPTYCFFFLKHIQYYVRRYYVNDVVKTKLGSNLNRVYNNNNNTIDK